MKIEAIEIHRVGMPLVYPFRTAYGNDDRVESVLVKLVSGKLHGWGESTPWQSPGYSPECAPTAFIVAKNFLAPRLIGREIESGQALQDLLSSVKGNYFAKAAFDLAWWDLEARRREMPLYRLLGGQRNEVEVGADFGVMESFDLLVETIAEAVNAGFKRVKLKYRPGWDIPMLERVRQAFPDMTFHVDCNSAYTLKDLENLKQLDAFNLAMVEQPLMYDDLMDHATLQRSLKTPICLDESITSADRARKAIAIGACEWVNVKPGRVGGLTNALAIHDVCEKHGIPCWVGGMLESAIGGRHCLALATLPNFKYPNDIFPSERFFRADLSQPDLTLSGRSLMTLPETPGVGSEPHEGRLAAATLEKISVFL